ncbi:NAD-dependent deacetylase [Pontimonas sp.]|nr:NAD-dependent deacetylase [Microbacteriaceae bacterium]MDA9786942.1 NAD-dependent deacetylase [Pontimonas sp.]
MPAARHEVDDAIEALRGRSTAVLTGAGISTDSGIPDYRGEGAPKAHPMTFQNFMESHRHRQRYWLGSHLGWGRFASATPNGGHTAIARAEASKAFSGVVTQNVDALHHKAGSLRVVDLHGRLDKVRCVHCGQSFTRSAVAQSIDRLNPWLAVTDMQGHVRPDGDVDIAVSEDFVIPRCDMCEGVLKPEVIFFGEFVPPSVFDQAAGLLARSQALIVAGSSLVVNTGMRLVSLAHKKKLPIVIINRGPTKADRMATVRIEGGTSETLGAIVEGLGL